MNQPKVTDLDDSNVLLATPRVVSCTEGARVQPEGPQQAAHDARTRLLHRLEPDTLPLWREAELLVDRTRAILIIDDTTLDTPDPQEVVPQVSKRETPPKTWMVLVHAGKSQPPRTS